MAEKNPLDPASVAKRLKNKPEKARLEDLRDKLIQAYGGLDGFAELCLQTFNKAKEGSLARATMLRIPVDLMKLTHKTEPRKSEDEFTDEELEAEIDKSMGRVLKATPIVDLAKGDSGGTPPQPTT